MKAVTIAVQTTKETDRTTTKTRTTFGIPDSLPPLDLRALRGYCVFAGMGLFVLVVRPLQLAPDSSYGYALRYLLAGSARVWTMGIIQISYAKAPYRGSDTRGELELHEDTGRVLLGHHDWRWPWLLFMGQTSWSIITGYSWLASGHRRIRRLDYFAHGMVASLPHRDFIGIDGRRVSPAVFGQRFNCSARGGSILVGQFGLCGNSLWADPPSQNVSYIGSFVARKARF